MHLRYYRSRLSNLKPVETAMPTTALTRRTLLQTAAITTVAAPFVHGAYAAGKLTVAVWDHWVPGANDVLDKLCHEWAAKEKIDGTVAFLTSQGDRLIHKGTSEPQ